MIVISWWRIADRSCIVAIRLTVAVVRVSALLGHAVVVSAVLILIHVLRAVILVRSAVTTKQTGSRIIEITRNKKLSKLTVERCYCNSDGAAVEASMRSGSVVACCGFQRNCQGLGRNGLAWHREVR